MADDPTLDETDPIDPAAHQAALDEIAGLKIDNAMLAAGVDTSSPIGAMFRKAYDGDPDVEKIRTAATAIPGVLKTVEAPAAATAEEPDREPGEEGQLADRAALTGGDAAGAEDPNPKAVAFDGAKEAIANGARVEDAMGMAIEQMVTAANGGDKRVLVER